MNRLFIINCSRLITDPCGKRGITWTKTPGYAIDKYNDKTINNVLTATRCRQLCLSEKSFLCRSMEYLAGMGKCVLSKSKRGDVMPAYFIRWPGYVYQDWSCKTGKRKRASIVWWDGWGWLDLSRWKLYVLYIIRNNIRKTEINIIFIITSDLKILSTTSLAVKLQSKNIKKWQARIIDTRIDHFKMLQ